mmetsp:Transcript_101853/g.271014  ORF Transcript_101853/g.271014 Transcript_101853/m.271014 type:complete len:206 (-) Transcript_101853:618-1235(-)
MIEVPVPLAKQEEKDGKCDAPWHTCRCRAVPETVARRIQQSGQDALSEAHVCVGCEDGEHLQACQPPGAPFRSPPLAGDHQLEHHGVRRRVDREDTDPPREAVGKHLLWRLRDRPQLLVRSELALDAIASQDVGHRGERKGQEDQEREPVTDLRDVAHILLHVAGQVRPHEAVEGLDRIGGVPVELLHEVLHLCAVRLHLALGVL